MSLGLEDSAYKKLHKINQRLQSNKEEINNIQKELWTNDVKIPISQILNNQQLNNEILEIESKSLTKKQTLYSKIYELIFASTKKIEDDVVNKDKQARSIINTANGTNISIDDLLSIDNLTSEEQEILKSFNNSEQNTSDISYNKLLNNIYILPDNLIDKIEKKLEINKEKREDGVLIKYLGPLFFTIVGITLTLVGIFFHP